MTRRLREDVDITKPPYSTRYPQLLKTYTDPPDAQRCHYVSNNVLVRSGSLIRSSGGNVMKDNFETDEDPGFIDADNMNFQLRDDSIIYKKIPGFKKIPFEKIGLYKDQCRKVLP